MIGKIIGIIISSVMAATAIFGIIFFSVKRKRKCRVEEI